MKHIRISLQSSRHAKYLTFQPRIIIRELQRDSFKRSPSPSKKPASSSKTILALIILIITLSGFASAIADDQGLG
jgi:hypothetical protein